MIIYGKHMAPGQSTYDAPGFSARAATVNMNKSTFDFQAFHTYNNK